MLSYGTIYYAVQGSSNFLVCGMKSYGVSCGVTIQMKATEPGAHQMEPPSPLIS